MQSELIETRHGRCALIGGDLDEQLLPADEQRALAAMASTVRRRERASGRIALHVALGDFTCAIGTSERGAPVLPAGWVGSVSHKGARAVGLVAPADAGWVGGDLELAAPPRADIARRILTPREHAALGDPRGREVTLRFAIKEAIYKAIDPVLGRYVRFTEVELDVAPDGTCAVTSALPLAIEASWCEHAGHWLATARARRW
jgi:enterobactin synthetase component D